MVDELKLEEVVAKEVADLSDEEKTFLKEKATELTDDQKEKFKEVLEAGDAPAEETEED